MVESVPIVTEEAAREAAAERAAAEKAKRPVTAYRVSFCPNAISTMSQRLTPVTRPFR